MSPKSGIGWKFYCSSLLLNMITIGLFAWFFNEVKERNELVDEYLVGAEINAHGIFQTEILNYHFAKKHPQHPDKCTECAVIINQRTADIKDFYKDNK